MLNISSMIECRYYTFNVCEDSPNVTLIPTSLLVGDSLLARLDPERLGKGKKTILNLAKGGNKICNVIDSLKAFIADSGSEKYLVK